MKQITDTHHVVRGLMYTQIKQLIQLTQLSHLNGI